MVSRFSSAVLVCAALVSLGTPALAQQAKHHTHKMVSSTDVPWKQFYSDSTVAVSIDPHGTIRHSDGTYTAHLRWAYISDQEIGGGRNYRIMRETRLIDCKSMGSKPVTGSTFDASGKLVSSFTTSSKDLKYMVWMTRRPGTSGEKVFQTMCRVLKKRS